MKDDIREIEQLKYAYFRCLDTKNWAAMTALFCEDAETFYDDGKYSQTGRDEIIAFLESTLGTTELVSMHLGHHPEIRLVSEEVAEGNWYLEDRVIATDGSWRLHGTAIYSDVYRRERGRWRIERTGYSRIFEELTHLRDGEEERTLRTRF